MLPRLTFLRRFPQMSVQCPRNAAQHLGSVHRGHNQGVKSSISTDLQLYLMAPFGIFFHCMMNQALRRALQATHKPQLQVMSLATLQPCLLLPCLNVCSYNRSLKMGDCSPWPLPPSQLGSHHSSYPQCFHLLSHAVVQ